MVRQPPMQISIAALVWHLAWVSALVALVGVWPTWHLRGHEGLLAQVCAGGLAAGVAVASGLLMTAIARRGPAVVALGFMVAIPFRIAVCCVAGMLLVSKYRICVPTFFVWLGLFYLATMLREGAWLSVALNRDADRVSLGELRRPCRQIWDRHRIR